MYNKTVLKNGVRIISEPLDHLRSVSLGIWVNTGSRDEIRSENGISHFIEHMIFKGTRNRTSLEIAKELDAIGGMSNAFTGKENTCFYAKVLGKHFTRVADILSDIFLNSTFDPDDMERERKVIFQEISMVEDTPDDNVHVLFNRLFWTDHPIGMSVLGTGETVSAIAKETILRYIDKFYGPERILVVAAGDVDHQAMVSCFEPLFGSAPGGKNSTPERTVPTAESGVSFHFKDLEQVHICLGGEAPSQTSDKRFVCAIFNTILGGNMSSRLFQEIRENRGLAYAVYSFVSSYVDAGLLGVYMATDTKNVNPALETVQKEIKKIIKGEVSESDLIAAKDHLIGGIYLSSESSDSRMMRMAKNEFVFGRYVDSEELVSELEKVTVDEVVDVAGDIFRDGKVSLTMLGPFREEDLDRSNLRL
ncbi:MAG: insulinase family protein [Deltaproteobacteria bacterium]|nr:insulinase family protein [Deltaproteobacteria bacterium]MBW2344535.1 insulinase family protein [Deltaproteobacteria bacterium]